jgi:hypothetical protein
MTERSENPNTNSTKEVNENENEHEIFYEKIKLLNDEITIIEENEKRLSKNILNLDHNNKLKKFNLLKTMEQIDYKTNLVENLKKKQNSNTDEGKQFIHESKFLQCYSKVENYFRSNFPVFEKISNNIKSNNELLHNSVMINYKDANNVILSKIKITIGLTTTIQDIIEIAKNVNEINENVILTNSFDGIISDLNINLNSYLWNYSPDIIYFNLFLESHISNNKKLNKNHLKLTMENKNKSNSNDNANTANNENDESNFNYEVEKLFKSEVPILFSEISDQNNINRLSYFGIDFIDISDINYSFMYLIITILLFILTLIGLININDPHKSKIVESEIINFFNNEKVTDLISFREYILLTLFPNLYWTSRISNFTSSNCIVDGKNTCISNEFIDFISNVSYTKEFVEIKNDNLILKLKEFEGFILNNRINSNFRVVSKITHLYKCDQLSDCTFNEEIKLFKSGIEKSYGFNFVKSVVDESSINSG